MKIRELLQTTLATMRLHKRRTFLTMIGIIIGIAAVITIMSLGNGFRQQFMDTVVKDDQGRTSQQFFYNLTGEITDYELERLTPFSATNVRQIEGIAGVDEVLLENEDQSNQTFFSNLGYRQQNIDASLKITEESDFEIISGRNLTSIDNQRRHPYMIIDESLAMELFQDPAKALHQIITLNQHEFTIVGIYQQPEIASPQMGEMSMGDIGANEVAQVYVPQKTYKQFDTSQMMSYSMTVYFQQGADMKKVSKKVDSYLQEKGSGLEYGSYQYFDGSEMMEELGRTLQTITYFISAIAAISLFIAGVGVMNMMYISVSERTKEIGIRRSLGATEKSIQWQFLLEGITITLFGGIIGYSCGVGIAMVAGNFLPFKPALDIPTALLSVFISIIIGIIFSVFPARQASKKNVVEILR